MRPLLKSRQWFTSIGLFVLVLAAVIGSFLTRDARIQATNSRTRRPAVVDERPLQTARNVAKLSATWDEQRFANQVLRAADHEVDLAFADALRDAANHPVPPTPQTQALYAHLNKSQELAKRAQDRVDELKKQLAAASGSRRDEIQDELDLAQAQLELDNDDVDSAKTDLIRSGADKFSRVQRQFQRHEDAEHAADTSHGPTAPNATPINYRADTLLGQVEAWRALRTKAAQLQSALDEAADVTASLSQAHDTLEQQFTTEKAAGSSTSQPASGSPPQAPTSKPAIAALKTLSDDQKTLGDLSKRMQDMQETQTAYGNWIALLQTQQRMAVHGMIQSALWILLIILLVYLADRVIDHYLTATGEERTRLRTLRVVIRFAAQAAGVLLILFVVLGTPQQMPTILGFAGAGLTVALKDFIVAFFGWFVLMGKNGLRVGDWVEINGVAGEVIEINLLRTVLLETGNWATTGHPTGRKVAFVNSYAIEGHFFNFTTSGQWLWDELQITVPSDQDPYPLIDAIQATVTKETEVSAKAAEQEWERTASHYRVRSVSPTPAVTLRPTPTGVEIHIRYITRAQERVAMRARLNQALVELLHHKGTGATVSASN
ncbi:MAG: mechanosensitive ion channel [Acidobacteriia bacterium]|nr:mechanosensitive ion channel [Terriglobia bacterium]